MPCLQEERKARRAGALPAQSARPPSERARAVRFSGGLGSQGAARSLSEHVIRRAI